MIRKHDLSFSKYNGKHVFYINNNFDSISDSEARLVF